MSTKLHTFWERLSGTFWFLPVLMIAAAIALAMTTTAIDERVDGPSDSKSKSQFQQNLQTELHKLDLRIDKLEARLAISKADARKIR